MRLFANIQEIKDRKIITITESQMFDLILEAATIQDIYQKYYSNIPENEFWDIIKADPTYNPQKPQKMGKFGKWLLGIYLKGNLQTEDLYKATDYLSYFVKFNGKIQQKDIMKYKSLPELYSVVEPFISNPDQAASKSEEVRKIKEGAEKVYEDDTWLVIVPHTQEASCYYGKGTQWCTAATGSKNYFDYYNEQGLLYININKKTNKKYQFHFETCSYMDATDKDILHPVAETIGLTEELTNFYIQKYGKNAVIDLTTELYTEELDSVTNLPDYYLYDDAAQLMKYNEEKMEFDIVYQVDDNYKQIQNFDIAKRFIPICEDDFYVNIFDTQYDEVVFDESDNIDIIDFKEIDTIKNCEYLVIHHKNDTQQIFSLKTMSYTSQEFGYNNKILTPLCGRRYFQYYNHDLTIVREENPDNINDVKGYALYSLSQGKILSNFFKYTQRETFYYNYNGKIMELQFETLFNKFDDYQEAMLIMYDGKLYPLNVFSQKSDQILDEYFSNIQESKNRKINTITESQMFDLILEAATVQDIYQKYYSNIPENEFWDIIKADPTYNPQKPQKMGKYGKWLLNLYKQNKLKTEDLYKATDYLSYFVKYYNRIENKDINKISDLPSLFNVIRPFKEAEDNGEEMATSKSDEIRKIKEDAEKVYEDDTWLVIVPHTQEASCYYGKNTQWCTAATSSQNYFDYYNKKGLLYININKKTNKKYQFHFETNSFMDATDKHILCPVAETIGLTENLVNFYIQKYGHGACIDLTTKYDSNRFTHVICLLNYFYDNEYRRLLKYNEQEKDFNIVYTINDGEFINDYAIARRFIPILGQEGGWINLFDTKYDKLVFDENDNIVHIELLDNADNLDNIEYIDIYTKNKTHRIFSLKTMTYTSEEIGKNYMVDSPLYECEDCWSFQYYNHDLTTLHSPQTEHIALYSLSQGKRLSDFFEHTRIETIYYNLNGKVTELGFFVLYNETPNDQDAILIMYDGKLYPLNIFHQNSNQILNEYFSKNNRN